MVSQNFKGDISKKLESKRECRREGRRDPNITPKIITKGWGKEPLGAFFEALHVLHGPQ